MVKNSDEDKGKPVIDVRGDDAQIDAYIAALLEEYKDLMTKYPDLNENIKKLIQLLVYKLHIDGEMSKREDAEEQHKKRVKKLSESLSDELLEMDLQGRDLIINAKIIRMALLCFASINQNCVPKLVNKFMNIVVSLAHNHLGHHLPDNLDINSRVCKLMLLKNLADFCMQNGQAQMLARAQALYKAVIALYPELHNNTIQTQFLGNKATAIHGTENITKLEIDLYRQADKSLSRIEHIDKDNNLKPVLEDKDFKDFQHEIQKVFGPYYTNKF